MPELYSSLTVESEQVVILEVTTHLNERTVRCLALTPTRGLKRGLKVYNTDETITVPVGDVLLGIALAAMTNTFVKGLIFTFFIGLKEA